MIMHWLLLLHHSLDGAILLWDHQEVISMCVYMILSGICDYLSIDFDCGEGEMSVMLLCSSSSQGKHP